MSLLSSASAIWFITLLSVPSLIRKNIERLSPLFIVGVIPLAFFGDFSPGILAAYLAVQIWVFVRKSPSWLFVPALFVPYVVPVVIAAIAYRSREISMTLYAAITISFLLISWQFASLLLVASYIWHRLFRRFSETPVLLFALFYASYLAR